jgi:hypothetical protein
MFVTQKRSEATKMQKVLTGMAKVDSGTAGAVVGVDSNMFLKHQRE